MPDPTLPDLRLVYVAHRFGGDQRNADAAEQWTAELSKHFDALFICPWLPMVRNWVDSGETRDRCIMLDIAAVKRCDEAWFITGSDGAFSAGMEKEYEAAKAAGLKCRVFHEETLDFMLSEECDAAFAATKERIRRGLAGELLATLEEQL